jgi:hypothetical protein
LRQRLEVSAGDRPEVAVHKNLEQLRVRRELRT